MNGEEGYCLNKLSARVLWAGETNGPHFHCVRRRDEEQECGGGSTEERIHVRMREPSSVQVHVHVKESQAAIL
jgi:hypothetical protein